MSDEQKIPIFVGHDFSQMPSGEVTIIEGTVIARLLESGQFILAPGGHWEGSKFVVTEFSICPAQPPLKPR